MGRRRAPISDTHRMGGDRAGRPGASYQNRSDLAQGPRAPSQPVKTATGQPYGAATAQAQAQQAVPLPDFAAMHLARPTERPQEPVTAGLPMGPGPGPEAMPMMGTQNPTSGDEVAALNRATYMAYPTDEMHDLIIEDQAKGY
jgi:hypothetical protein